MDLAQLKDAQIDRLIDLGFHGELGLSPEAYRSRFPTEVVKPDAYVGRFDLFLLVEGDPSIRLKFQNRAAGIVEFVDSEKLITEGPQPMGPYFIWTHDGKRYRSTSSSKSREAFSIDEVPCSQLEVTSLYIHYPELFKGCGIDSGRSYLKDDYYATIIWVQEYPELALHHLNDQTEGLGVLSRGKLPEEV